MGFSSWLGRRKARAAVHRRLLEGGAEILEAALGPYLLLTRCLELPEWRAALAFAIPCARTLVDADQEVAQALSTARRRLVSAKMSRFDDIPRLVVRVELLRSRLSSLLRLRAGGEAPAIPVPLGVRLALLLASVAPPASAVAVAPPPRSTRSQRPPWPRFQVQLLYREPTYELRTGIPRVYQLSLHVDAASEADASVRAERELFRRSAESGVGWAPEVVSSVASLEGAVSVSTAQPGLPAAAWVPPPEPPGRLQGRLVILNAPKDATAEELAEYGRSKVAFAVFHPDKPRRVATTTLHSALAELLGLAEDLRAFAQSLDSSEWLREQALSLDREAWELAGEVDPHLASQHATREARLPLDIAGRRIGALLGALLDAGGPSGQSYIRAQAYATRLAAFHQRVRCETPPSEVV